MMFCQFGGWKQLSADLCVYYAPINVNPEGGGVGQRVGI
jgi:hypothetical protein